MKRYLLYSKKYNLIIKICRSMTQARRWKIFYTYEAKYIYNNNVVNDIEIIED